VVKLFFIFSLLFIFLLAGKTLLLLVTEGKVVAVTWKNRRVDINVLYLHYMALPFEDYFDLTLGTK
jgi:hypothetical protein